MHTVRIRTMLSCSMLWRRRKIDTGDLNYIHTLERYRDAESEGHEGRIRSLGGFVSCLCLHVGQVRAAFLRSQHGPELRPDCRFGQSRCGAKSLANNKIVAIPGTLTTAFLALRLFEPDVQYKVVPFDKILDEVQRGKYDAGLLIHEGQLTYREMGLHKVVDLGEWWLKETGLPLPLGGNVIKRDLGKRMMERVAQDIKKASSTASIIARKRWLMPFNSPVAWTRIGSIDSSGCTSTNSRWITAAKAARPSGSFSRKRIRKNHPGKSRHWNLFRSMDDEAQQERGPPLFSGGVPAPDEQGAR